MKTHIVPSIVTEVEKFLDFAKDDKFHNNYSWDDCFIAFRNFDKPNDELALHLGFYLASWGMYRGSTGLSHKNHKIHIEAVKILKDYKDLRAIYRNEINGTKVEVDSILKLKYKLVKVYEKENYQIFNKKTLKFDSRKISGTDTLISKILLGTLGCVPAYDTLFIQGIKTSNLIHNYRLNKSSLEQICKFSEIHNSEILEAQKKCRDGASPYYKNSEIYYPKMKILDMYFWHIGFCKTPKN